MKIYRFTQVILLLVGSGSFSLFLYTLESYSAMSEYRVSAAGRDVLFRYGSEIFYLSNEMAFKISVMKYVAIGSILLLVIAGVIAGDFASRYTKKRSGREEDT